MNPSFLALSAIALGQALQTRDGLYDRLGMVFLTLAILSCAAAFVPAFRDLRLNLLGVLSAGLFLQFMELFLHRPASETALARGVRAALFPHACLGIASIAATLVAVGARRWRAAFRVALAAQLAAAFWVIQATPEPHMDVWWAQQGGLAALTRGESPFSSAFPDIYAGAAWYPEWLRRGGSILLGFPYPPLTLLFELPSFVLAGDLRYGNAVALALAGVLIARLSNTRTAALAALTLLVSPRVFYLLESGWTEPSVILFFSAAVFCAVRLVKALPFAIGLAAVSKQNMPLLLPLVPLLREPLRALRGRPAWAACVLVAPLLSLLAVLPDLDGFLRSAVRFPASLALRTDVLTYPAMIANETGFHSSSVATGLGFGLAALVIGVLFFAAPRTAAGFAGACAATFLVFFAFNRYAGGNYYFFVIAALCCAVAAQAEGEIEPLFAMT